MGITVVVLSVGFWVNATWADCPTRAHEQMATLSTAMYHWGRAARVVGQLGHKGSVTSQDISEARQAVATAQFCMQMALSDTNKVFWPRKAYQLAGPALDDYLARYFAFLSRFHEILDNVASRLCAIDLSESDTEIFVELIQLEQQLLQIAREAHATL